MGNSLAAGLDLLKAQIATLSAEVDRLRELVGNGADASSAPPRLPKRSEPQGQPVWPARSLLEDLCDLLHCGDGAIETQRILEERWRTGPESVRQRLSEWEAKGFIVRERNGSSNHIVQGPNFHLAFDRCATPAPRPRGRIVAANLTPQPNIDTFERSMAFDDLRDMLGSGEIVYNDAILAARWGRSSDIVKKWLKDWEADGYIVREHSNKRYPSMRSGQRLEALGTRG